MKNNNFNRRHFLHYSLASLGGLVLAACNAEGRKIPSEMTDEKKADSSSSFKEDKKTAEFITDADVSYVKKGEELYDKLRHGHNKRFNKFPAVIALCHTEAGVIKAIKEARLAGLPVAIKSGGHSLEGLSGSDGGMQINLSEFTRVEFLENDEVKLGPACTNAQLYEELLSRGRMIPGGSCGSVAVGGLASGGGYGMYSRKLGLTCDSLLSVRMIDGNGCVQTASGADELMRAIRGGGSGNFGVITEMIFKTHKAPPTLTAHRFRKFKTSVEEAQLRMEKWFEAAADLPPECFSVFIISSKTVFVLLTNFGEETEGVKKFMATVSEGADKVSIGNPQALNKAVQNFYGVQEPVFAKNSSVGLYKDFEDVRSFISEAIEKVQNTPGMLLSIGTLGGKINDAEAEKRSVFPHRSCNFLSELQTYWKTEAQTEKMVSAYKEVRDIFQNNGIDREYFNYPDLGFKNWEKAYYGDNYAFLQQVKKKYDPENVIRHEQSVRIN